MAPPPSGYFQKTHPFNMKLSMIAFFRISLLLPLIVPLLLIPLVWVFPNQTTKTISLYLGSSLSVGGIPYLLFSIYSFRWLRGKSQRQVVWRAAVSPLIFIPIETVSFFVFLCIFSRYHGGPPVITLIILYMIAMYVLLFGYGYVCLTLLLFFLAKKMRFIRPGL